MLARYAAADLDDVDDRRGRAMGQMVAAASVGALAGPNCSGLRPSWRSGSPRSVNRADPELGSPLVDGEAVPVGAVAGGGGVMSVQAPVEISYFHTAPVAWPATRSHRNHRC